MESKGKTQVIFFLDPRRNFLGVFLFAQITPEPVRRSSSKKLDKKSERSGTIIQLFAGKEKEKKDSPNKVFLI